MRFGAPLFLALAVAAGPASAAGLLIPEDKKLPPLAMVNHRVAVAIEDQVAVTTLEQTFRNHTDRALEATYLFPVPRGASVDKFTMWVDGKETAGELLDAKKAHAVYTEIVRRTQDPGLLEYLGNNLMRLRVFPVPPKGDQKVKISFKSVSQQDAGVVEYVYPLKTDGKGTRTLEEFSVKVSVKSQHPITNVYSPTHAITTTRRGEKEVAVEFEKNQAILDKDFQLFYGVGNQDIGLTPLVYKPVTAEDGYFMLLVQPRTDTGGMKRTPRDMVLVLDTSGSMSEVKMSQAKKALKFCLAKLGPDDRFGLIKFSTGVVRYRETLTAATDEQRERANKWVDDLRPGGGTAIWPALDEAISMKADDPGRAFNVVFFTDGEATVDETNPDKIVRNVLAKNTGNTRVFTFGVGDDVNAAMLDQIADGTRAVSTYVRPAEDIEAKVASLHGKISHPVMTDVRLVVGDSIKLNDVYPPKMPDIFHGNQLVVIGRYSGEGATAIKLAGMVAGEKTELVYELKFPAKTEDGKDFVEPLWARRKVGFLLDQIRANGEKKELVDEVVSLAKKYGIATPYTSYLVVPDGPLPVVPSPGRPGGPTPRPVPLPGPIAGGFGGGGFGGPGMAPTALQPAAEGGAAKKVSDFAKSIPTSSPAAPGGDGKPDALGGARFSQNTKDAAKALDELKREKDTARTETLAREVRKLQEQQEALAKGGDAFRARDRNQYQTGKLGVDLAVCANNLRLQQQLSLTANRQVGGRNCLEVGGVWIDDQYAAATPTFVVKAQSDAYFKLLEKRPELKDVYRLGNHLVWVTPSGTALVIDANDGKDQVTDDEVAKLFAAAKK